MTTRATGRWKRINPRRAYIENTSRNMVSRMIRIPTGIKSNWQNSRKRTKQRPILRKFLRISTRTFNKQISKKHLQESKRPREFNLSVNWRKTTKKCRRRIVIPTDILIHQRLSVQTINTRPSLRKVDHRHFTCHKPWTPAKKISELLIFMKNEKCFLFN